MRQITVRLRQGADLRKEIDVLAQTKEIQAGTVLSLVGSLECVCLRLADGKTSNTFNGPFEITSATGTVSPDGSHIHVSLADTEGKVIGGHLKEGSIVHTTVEVVLLDFDDVHFRRVRDSLTGYDELTIVE